MLDKLEVTFCRKVSHLISLLWLFQGFSSVSNTLLCSLYVGLSLTCLACLFLLFTEAYSEPYQKSKMVLFAKIVSD